MLTANEIRNIRFTKSMGGYKAPEVDDFVDQCADTVAALTAAKAELEKKLEVLADKLVEYRNDEDNIRTALLSAQRLGDTVVREAKHKAGLILEDARIKAEKITETAQRSIKDEEQELERIRREITNFKARMLSIYREHLSLIDVLPEVKEEKTEPAAESADTAVSPAAEEGKAEEAPAAEPVSQPAESAPVFAQTPAEPETEIAPVPEAAEGEPAEEPAAYTPAPVSRFANLKFGEDYDISADEEPEDTGAFRRRK